MQRRFAILDVFTDKSLAGNQLAVVFDSEGLSTKQMQALALEFNFPETVFVLPAERASHTAKVRIFTPGHEMPFAGHPTVGTAIALALENGLDQTGQGIVTLEEGVGPVRCGVRFDGERAFAEFDLPVVPEPGVATAERGMIASALGLDENDIGFENHKLGAWNGGVSFVMVPVHDLASVEKASPNTSLWPSAFTADLGGWGAYVYCRQTVGHDNDFHARMFAPTGGIPEDPATGSAVAAFAGQLAHCDRPVDGLHTIRIEQGIEMGRPSLITLEIEMANGAISGGRIGGHAVVFARGHFEG